MEQLLNFIKEFDLHNIISIYVIVWYFTKDLRKTIDSLDRDVREMNARIYILAEIIYGKEIHKHMDKK